jgi:hypothetical protein
MKYKCILDPAKMGNDNILAAQGKISRWQADKGVLCYD